MAITNIIYLILHFISTNIHIDNLSRQSTPIDNKALFFFFGHESLCMAIFIYLNPNSLIKIYQNRKL